MMRAEGRKYINTIQGTARCLMPNKFDNKVFIVDFVDNIHPYLKAHSKLRHHDYERVGYLVYEGYNAFLEQIERSHSIRLTVNNARK